MSKKTEDNEPNIRSLSVYTNRPNGEVLLASVHYNVPMGLTHQEIINRFGLKPHMKAVLEYSDGRKCTILNGAIGS